MYNVTVSSCVWSVSTRGLHTTQPCLSVGLSQWSATVSVDVVMLWALTCCDIKCFLFLYTVSSSVNSV